MRGPVGWCSRSVASRSSRPRAERCGLVQTRDAAVLEHLRSGLVDRGERNRQADRTVDADELLEVDGVGAVGAVLVLDLHEDDRAAPVDLPGLEHRCELLHVPLDRAQVLRLVTPDADGPRAEQPARQPAVGPLGADVGPRSDDRVHALGRHLVEEPSEVEPAAEVEDVLLRGMRVPRDVGLDRVQTHLARLADAVAPQIRVHAEVVQRPRQDLEGFAVEFEVLGADTEVRHSWAPQPERIRGSTMTAPEGSPSRPCRVRGE